MLSLKIKNSYRICVLAMLTMFASSCYYDKAELLYPNNNQPANCTTIPAKFNADILPLITVKCAVSGCHNSSAAGGIILSNYAQIFAAKDRINARAVVEKSMPQSGALLPGEINTIKCWLEAGALNN